MRKSFEEIFNEAAGSIEPQYLSKAENIYIKYSKGSISITISGKFKFHMDSVGFYIVELTNGEKLDNTIVFSGKDIKSWRYNEREKTIQVELK